MDLVNRRGGPGLALPLGVKLRGRVAGSPAPARAARVAALTAWIMASFQGDDTFKVTLVFESMHCEECRVELESVLRRAKGFKSVEFRGKRVHVVFEDGVPPPTFDRLPRDLVRKEVLIEIRGTVSFSEEGATLLAKGSGAVVALVNPEKPEGADRLAELRKRVGGKNRFLVRGTLVGARTVVLDSFEPTDWKDK